MNQQTKSGFTIVELLIVIIVIAILAAISIVAYSGIQQRARDSAQKQNLAQVERQIMAYALQKNDESISISGSLVGYQEGAGDSLLLRQPLTGTPGITMYMVYGVTNTSGSWQLPAYLTPETSTNRFAFQTTAAGDSRMSVRVDTSAQSNSSAPSQPGVRTPGSTTISWLQVSNNSTVRSDGYNQAAAQNTATLSPGTGLSFTGVSARDYSGNPTKAVLVFNAAHDQITRDQVIKWLADKYNVVL